MTRATKIYLAASFTLNVLLIGMMMGHVLHHVFHPEGSDRAIADLTAQLPEDKRKLVEDTLQSAWSDMHATRDQMMEGKKEIVQVISADTFDEQRYMTVSQHLLDLHKQMKMRMNKAITMLAPQLNQQERKILADIVSLPPPDAPGCNGSLPTR